jgi:hypothetical protein
MSPEFFIAILSLVKLVGLKPLRILKQDITAALKYPEAIRSDIQKLLKGESLPELDMDLKFKDVPELAKQIEELNLEAQLQKSFVSLANAELPAVEIGTTWNVLVESLRNFIPADTVLDTGLSITDAPASSISLQTKFLWAARIAENPRWILRLFEKSQLSDFDVTTLQSLYPEIYELMVTIFIEEIINNFKISDALPRKLKLMLSIFLQTPVLSVETVQAYKAGEAELPPPPSPEQVAPKTEIDLAKGEI